MRIINLLYIYIESDNIYINDDEIPIYGYTNCTYVIYIFNNLYYYTVIICTLTFTIYFFKWHNLNN